MSSARISRRGLMAGTGAALAAVALPGSIMEAVGAEMPSTGLPAALPTVFDPAAFVDDLIGAGLRITACRPVPMMLDDEEDLRPYFAVHAGDGRGLGQAYDDILERWSAAIKACPDHVGEVVRYVFGQVGGELCRRC